MASLHILPYIFTGVDLPKQSTYLLVMQAAHSSKGVPEKTGENCGDFFLEKCVGRMLRPTINCKFPLLMLHWVYDTLLLPGLVKYM